MKYRVGAPNDWVGITELLATSGMYGGIDAAVMADGGHWILAEDEEELAGCCWVLASGKHCYIDFLAIRPDKQESGLGVRLSIRVVQYVKSLGVEHVRAMTVEPVVSRMLQSMGGFAHDGGYTMLYLHTGD